ncbi:MAG: DUF58 domain-containing protein [Clostridia bacterium]|nr:DUF58 domain-containing protein [Clostridia bacterium]
MELIVIATLVMLFFLIELLFYKKLLLKRVEYSLSFSKTEAFEGDDMFVDEVIYNRKPVAMPWIKADIHASKFLEFANASSAIIDERRLVTSGFMLRGFQKTKRRWYMKCTRRGVFNIENATITCGDLLGLVTESKAIPINTTLTVYPGTIDINEIFFSSKDLMGEAIVKRFILDDPFIVKGTRDYIPGDAINKINWNATARYNRLMVKENDFTSKIGITALLNIQSAENEFNFVKDREVIEFGIKAISTIINRGFKEGMPVRFGSNGCTISNQSDMILTSVGTGQEHVLELLATLSNLHLKNIRSFELYLEKIEDEIRNTQVFIVTAYLNEAIIEVARRMQRKGNTLKFLVLDIYDESMIMPSDMEIFFMRRELENESA